MRGWQRSAVFKIKPCSWELNYFLLGLKLTIGISVSIDVASNYLCNRSLAVVLFLIRSSSNSMISL